ncbi:MAG: hypothetical protein NTW79_03140 [Candidatus Berkelbacteria bacterium]|nr:hypothetical protein [Candidatus Berkelbacteria bacterium]
MDGAFDQPYIDSDEEPTASKENCGTIFATVGSILVILSVLCAIYLTVVCWGFGVPKVWFCVPITSIIFGFGLIFKGFSDVAFVEFVDTDQSMPNL